VSARDLAGNNFANNPISLNATTTAVISCSGTDSVAQQGAPFSIGYNYTFETIGNSVKITFELLDTDKVGVVGILWRQSPFAETQMTNVSGNIFTHTITGQTLGSTISYGVKFAYVGGFSVTNYFQYVVGSNCALNVSSASELDQFSFVNPVHDYLTISYASVVDKIEIYNMIGNLVSETINTNTVDVHNLSQGIYLVAVYSGKNRSVKKMVIK